MKIFSKSSGQCKHANIALTYLHLSLFVHKGPGVWDTAALRIATMSWHGLLLGHYSIALDLKYTGKHITTYSTSYQYTGDTNILRTLVHYNTQENISLHTVSVLSIRETLISLVSRPWADMVFS